MEKFARYQCIGGPRDGDSVVIRREARSVTLDGTIYRVRWWIKRDENGLRLWERECLVVDQHPGGR